jgi:LuxR family maltose regulon positive regulatory protein
MNEAEQYFHHCIDLSRQWGENDIQAIAYATLARLRLAQGNQEAAQEAFWKANQFPEEHNYSTLRSSELKNELARYWLAQGNLEKLSQLIPSKVPLNQREFPLQLLPENVILLRLLFAHNEYERVIAFSTKLLQQAEATVRMGLVIEILILQSLAYQGRKDTDSCLAILERALDLAKEEGYIRIFLDEGESMTRLLCQVQSRQTGNSYAAELLSEVGEISGMTQPSMQLLVDPLTTREVEVLQLITTGYSNQDISKQLFISIATVKRHISNIYTKLGVKSRTQAVAIGKELKIIE